MELKRERERKKIRLGIFVIFSRKSVFHNKEKRGTACPAVEMRDVKALERRTRFFKCPRYKFYILRVDFCVVTFVGLVECGDWQSRFLRETFGQWILFYF